VIATGLDYGLANFAIAEAIILLPVLAFALGMYISDRLRRR
jgi:hypothetical protein